MRVVASSAIGYVNLHATATRKNDDMEAKLMARVFPDGVATSGTKPLTGHQLGAAGATELGFAWLTLRARWHACRCRAICGTAKPTRRCRSLDLVESERYPAARGWRAIRDEQFVCVRRQQCQPDPWTMTTRDDPDARHAGSRPATDRSDHAASRHHAAARCREHFQRRRVERASNRAGRRLVRRRRRRDARMDRHRTDGAGHRGARRFARHARWWQSASRRVAWLAQL